jgi:primosomal replication protein N
MVQINNIIITGWIASLLKQRTIKNIIACEFLLKTRSWYIHCNEFRKESFSIPVVAFRKYAKRCLKMEVGTQIKVEGQLSWAIMQNGHTYTGFYINADKITGG